MKYLAQGLILGTLMTFPLMAQDKEANGSGHTINVDIETYDNDEGRIRLTLPLSLLSLAKGQLQNALDELAAQENLDFPKLWAAIKEAGPNEFVELNNEEAEIKVSTTKEKIKVLVVDKKEGSEINVELPMVLGDALFTSREIDYTLMMDALLSLKGRDLVLIDASHMQGRVWIE